MTRRQTRRRLCLWHVCCLFVGMVVLLTVEADAADPDTIPSDSLAVAIDESIWNGSVVEVIPQDGRPSQPVPVYVKGEARYVSLVSLCRALGVRYTWDPYTYRGWIETDSLQTRFTLRSPILIHGGEGRQLKHGIESEETAHLVFAEYLAVLV